MGAALLVLVPVAGLVVWAFFRFTPAASDPKGVRRFNGWSLAIALASAGGWTVRTYRTMSSTADSAWWPVVSVLVALIVIPLVLALAALLRHFVFPRQTL